MYSTQSGVTTAHATDSAADADALGRLFSDYRMFYEREPDLEAAKRFVSKRLRASSSHFIKAIADDTIVGFVHLSECLATLSMREAWFVEDLFVDPHYRRRGVGSALLRHAETFARNTNGARLSLSTARTNEIAQRLYVANGYELDETFLTFHLKLT